jgi:hypothetical protein
LAEQIAELDDPAPKGDYEYINFLRIAVNVMLDFDPETVQEHGDEDISEARDSPQFDGREHYEAVG